MKTKQTKKKLSWSLLQHSTPTTTRREGIERVLGEAHRGIAGADEIHLPAAAATPRPLTLSHERVASSPSSRRRRLRSSEFWHPRLAQRAVALQLLLAYEPLIHGTRGTWAPRTNVHVCSGVGFNRGEKSIGGEKVLFGLGRKAAQPHSRAVREGLANDNVGPADVGPTGQCLRTESSELGSHREVELLFGASFFGLLDCSLTWHARRGGKKRSATWPRCTDLDGPDWC